MTKIKFIEKIINPFARPTGIDKDGHVIYEVDMDDPNGPWTHVDKEDKLYDYIIEDESVLPLTKETTNLYNKYQVFKAVDVSNEEPEIVE